MWIAILVGLIIYNIIVLRVHQMYQSRTGKQTYPKISILVPVSLAMLVTLIIVVWYKPAAMITQQPNIIMQAADF